MRQKANNIREIKVECNQTAMFPHADLKKPGIRAAADPFPVSGFRIVPGLAEKIQCSAAEVLVQLELHAALEPGRSTERSRLISAP